MNWLLITGKEDDVIQLIEIMFNPRYCLRSRQINYIAKGGSLIAYAEIEQAEYEIAMFISTPCKTMIVSELALEIKLEAAKNGSL